MLGRQLNVWMLIRADVNVSRSLERHSNMITGFQQSSQVALAVLCEIKYCLPVSILYIIYISYMEPPPREEKNAEKPQDLGKPS